MKLQNITRIMTLFVLILIPLVSCDRQANVPTSTPGTFPSIENPTRSLDPPQPTARLIPTPTIYQAAATVTPTIIEKEIPPMIEIPDDVPSYEPTVESYVKQSRVIIFSVINEVAIEEYGFEMKQVAPIFTAEQVGALEAYGFEKEDPYVAVSYYIYANYDDFLKGFFVAQELGPQIKPENSVFLAGGTSNIMNAAYYYSDNRHGDSDQAYNDMLDIFSQLGIE